MDAIESDIVENDYDGLATREARRKQAKDRYKTSQEAAELRSLAHAALLRKEETERGGQPRKNEIQVEKTPREFFIKAELINIEQALPANEIKALVENFVQVLIHITEHTSLLVNVQFPEAYPHVNLTLLSLLNMKLEVVVLELRSKYLEGELLKKLKTAGEAEAKKASGGEQVLVVIDRLRSILTANRLAPAFVDLAQLKGYLAEKPGGELMFAKEKSGAVGVRLRCREYFLELDLLVPFGYPAKAVSIRKHRSNLPEETLVLFLSSAEERARRRAELPEAVERFEVGRVGAGSGAQSKSDRLSQSQTLAARNRVDALAAHSIQSQEKAHERRRQLEAAFVSRPSLAPFVQFLTDHCLVPLASGICRICKKQLLPTDPASVSRIPKSMAALKLYCGHMYHFKCVEAYISTPPFGKTCLHCGEKIEHSRLMTNEKILEQRWTHEQARKREIEDVTEFMSL